jgi:hypothetical protein
VRADKETGRQRETTKGANFPQIDKRRIHGDKDGRDGEWGYSQRRESGKV